MKTSFTHTCLCGHDTTHDAAELLPADPAHVLTETFACGACAAPHALSTADLVGRALTYRPTEGDQLFECSRGHVFEAPDDPDDWGEWRRRPQWGCCPVCGCGRVSLEAEGRGAEVTR